MKSSSPTGLVILRRIIKKSVPPSKKGGKKRGGRVKKKRVDGKGRGSLQIPRGSIKECFRELRLGALISVEAAAAES